MFRLKDEPLPAAQPGPDGPPQDQPAISLVVIGRNEGERLTACIEAIKACRYPTEKLELIYVDSNSTDESCARAEAAGASVLRITEGRLSAARARNLGWRAARHRLIHFFDADTLVHPDWLSKAAARMADPTIGCVFGRREEIRPRASIYMRVCAFDWHVPAGPWRLCGGDALFRKSVLEKIGGFREDMIAGEEPELSFRLRQLGLQIWRLDEPMVQHDLNMTTFRQYWRRAVRSGWAYLVVAARCRRGSERLWLKENLVNIGELLLWCVALAAGLGIWGWRGILLPIALLIARLLWIAAKARSRAENWPAALLFAGHCLFSRIPILVGQLKGIWHLLSRSSAELIEYKGPSPR